MKLSTTSEQLIKAFVDNIEFDFLKSLEIDTIIMQKLYNFIQVCMLSGRETQSNTNLENSSIWVQQTAYESRWYQSTSIPQKDVGATSAQWKYVEIKDDGPVEWLKLVHKF